MFITPKDLVPLWTVKEKAGTEHKVFTTWLNATTIDAIVMCGKRKAALNGVYLGSSFNLDTLSQSSDRYVLMVQSELSKSSRVIMALNVGSHWVLLAFERWTPVDPKNPERATTRMSSRKARPLTVCTLYDPMATSSLAFQVLVFAAKVCGKEPEFEASTDTKLSVSTSKNSRGRLRHKMISVRTQLPKYALSFFKLVNVGVQLSEEEGYNCGMYAALWARVMLHDWVAYGDGKEGSANPTLPKYSTAELMQQRITWNERLVKMIHRSQNSPQSFKNGSPSQQRSFSRLASPMFSEKKKKQRVSRKLAPSGSPSQNLSSSEPLTVLELDPPTHGGSLSSLPTIESFILCSSEPCTSTPPSNITPNMSPEDVVFRDTKLDSVNKQPLTILDEPSDTTVFPEQKLPAAEAAHLSAPVVPRKVKKVRRRQEVAPTDRELRKHRRPPSRWQGYG
jgi:hypothetical protein